MRRELQRFLLVGGACTVLLAGLLLNVLGMRLLHGYLHWHYVLSQVLTTMLTMSWNFAGHRHWTFASPRASE